jgi:hypothetical protein
LVSDQRAGSGDGGGGGADETEGVRGGAVVLSLDMFAVVELWLAEEMASFFVRAFYCCMSERGWKETAERKEKRRRRGNVIVWSRQQEAVCRVEQSSSVQSGVVIV